MKKNTGFFIFFAVIQGIIFLIHFLLYKSVTFFFFADEPLALPLLRLIFGLLSISFITSMMASHKWHSTFVRIYSKFSAIWFGSLYFWIISLLVIWLAYDISALFSDSPQKQPFVSFIIGAGLLGAIAAFVNARIVRTINLRIELNNLPEAWKGRKAVWASDLHIGHIRGWRHAEKVVHAINAEKPSIVFIGGDLFDGVNDDYKKAIAPISKLNSEFGTYFIYGNHEEFFNTERYSEVINDAGLKILKDEKIEIEGMQIIGVDHHTSHVAESFAKVLSGLVDPQKPSIVLKHEPNNLVIAEKAGVSLQISGHTHNAQIWPFNYIARKVYKGFEYGLKSFGTMQQLTSSGAGTWGPPFRVGSKTEIVVIIFI